MTRHPDAEHMHRARTHRAAGDRRAIRRPWGGYRAPRRPPGDHRLPLADPGRLVVPGRYVGWAYRRKRRELRWARGRRAPSMVRGGDDESVLPPDDSPPLSDDVDSAAKARSRADRTELAQGMDNNGSSRVTAPGRTLRCRWSTYSPRTHACRARTLTELEDARAGVELARRQPSKG